MKVRNGFVTNSSSSSFVVCFKSEDTLTKELLDMWPYPNNLEALSWVMNDVQKAARLTPDEVIEMIDKNDIAFWLSYNEGWRNSEGYRMHYWEYEDYPEYAAKVEAKYQEKVAEVRKAMEGNTVFMVLEYEDHDDLGSALEHEYMPNMPNVALYINNH